mmetsp:Transcript_13437/g.21395  ORF Transcript_13437/g.21395 Transcript_13437/m.21395 type:complete len:91 (-) Transcript_13437:87-359(-)
MSFVQEAPRGCPGAPQGSLTTPRDLEGGRGGTKSTHITEHCLSRCFFVASGLVSSKTVQVPPIGPPNSNSRIHRFLLVETSQEAQQWDQG